MAVFRVERNKGYTVMSNHHLRNKELTLKAKGLLSQMLSLPEDWDYTLAGLSHINREKIDAIREAVRELERAGYIMRSRERDEKGRLRGADYVIYEQPQPPISDLPTLENPILDNPTLEKPTQDNPTLENPTQLNKEIQRTDLPRKDKSNTDLSSTDSVPIHSQSPLPYGERSGKEASTQSAIEIYREIIQDNIEYDYLLQDPHIDNDRLNEIVDLMLAKKLSFHYLQQLKVQICQTGAKEKTLQSLKGCNASHSIFNSVRDIHSSSASTSLISFAVAVTIRNPLSLISSSRLSSCLRCVDLSISLFGKKNWSTDTSKRVTSS